MSEPYRDMSKPLADIASIHNVEPGKWVKFSIKYKVLPDGSIEAKEAQLVEVEQSVTDVRHNCRSEEHA